MIVFLAPGCTVIDSTGPSDVGARSIWVVGVSHIVLPDKVGRLSAIDASTLGIGWDGGPYLGWKAGNWISADPAACQLLVVIRSPAQAENAARVLQSLGGQQACIVDHTHSLQR